MPGSSSTFTFATSTGNSARMGSSALHGRHQGAQKSTTTGLSARRTASSKSLSVTSRTTANLQAAGERPEPQPGPLPDRLEHDGAAHLRLAHGPVGEKDRDLDHAEPLAQGPVGRLD